MLTVLEQLPDLVNNDPVLVRRGRFLNDVFMLEIGTQQYLIQIRQGRIDNIEQGPFVMKSWTFALRASTEVWQRFWQAAPPPGYHDIFALLRKNEMVFEGNLQPMMANLLYIKLLLAAPRTLTEAA